MRTPSAVAVVVVVASLAGNAPAQTSASDPCAAWTLNGYRLGMTYDEAAAVRPIKPANPPKFLGISAGGKCGLVKEKKRFGGFLAFDESDHLVFYRSIPEDHAVIPLREALEARLGGPGASQADLDRAGTRTSETTWRNEECDARILLRLIFPLGVPVPQIELSKLSRVLAIGSAPLD